MNFSSRQRAYLHHYGPWILGGGVVLVALLIEAIRHHVLSNQSALFFLILIPTIIIHEVSHGVVALWCGDTTARDARRLSLNPLRHVDPIGTVVVPILLILTTGIAFGWAKPVPVNINRLRHPRNQEILVSLAGPAVNILIALAMGFALHLTGNAAILSISAFQRWPLIDQVLMLAGFTNIVIATFNLLPIPPLDGSVLLERLLPASALPTYFRIRSFSLILVLAVVFLAPGALNSLFSHAVSIWESVVGISQFGIGL
ncbi:MAG TPA: site-2 protease family protein [Acidimicrobiales bacterium]|nr:site-2 protease family protein [Acidimicrobiales bacterium]